MAGGDVEGDRRRKPKNQKGGVRIEKVKSIWVMALVSLTVLALNVPGHAAETI
jgi:hypothetical protein